MTHGMLVQSLSSFEGQQDYKYHTEQLAIDHQFLYFIKMLKLDGGMVYIQEVQGLNLFLLFNKTKGMERPNLRQRPRKVESFLQHLYIGQKSTVKLHRLRNMCTAFRWKGCMSPLITHACIA
jgi:hypothetical protein